MLGRNQITQDELVARRMRQVFRRIRGPLPWFRKLDPEAVAHSYGGLMWDNIRGNVKGSADLSRARFHIGLSTSPGDRDSFDFLTKRAMLVTDTLLLSHDWTGPFHVLAYNSPKVDAGNSLPRNLGITALDQAAEFLHQLPLPGLETAAKLLRRNGMQYGMHCPNLHELGQWLLDAEPLLKAGLAWYLPSYSTQPYRDTWRYGHVLAEKPEQVSAIDYLIRDGRAVAASGAQPLKSQLIRPVLQIDLPFIDGVALRQFSQITVEEFASYSAFRDFLRMSFLEMDDAMNDVQSERELVKLGLRIKDEIRAARAEMVKARRKKAVAVTGAVVGSVGAVLVAVYGPALAAAVAAVGASAGGVWGIVNAAADNSTRALREDKWYYVWALSRKSNTPL